MATPPVVEAAGMKATGALRTIGEASRDTGVPHHILRFWETRFAQLRPLLRAGSRRYYRPEDVALVRRIDALLGRQGYTIRGVQQLLAGEQGGPAPAADDRAAVCAIRAMLAAALAEDDGATTGR